MKATEAGKNFVHKVIISLFFSPILGFSFRGVFLGGTTKKRSQPASKTGRV
jgi:phosphate/sulfate permease